MSSDSSKSAAPDPAAPAPPRRARLATVWLAGCSGCHMSFLDQDERLLDLAALADLVFSPIVDTKQFPADVDLTLVEGAVATEDQRELIATIRRQTRILVALGDCAVSGNVSAMRNPFGGALPILNESYRSWPPPAADPLDREPVPVLLDRVWPVHQVVEVDFVIPGCPPTADLIFEVTRELLLGRRPDLKGRYHFG